MKITMSLSLVNFFSVDFILLSLTFLLTVNFSLFLHNCVLQVVQVNLSSLGKFYQVLSSSSSVSLPSRCYSTSTGVIYKLSKSFIFMTLNFLLITQFLKSKFHSSLMIAHTPLVWPMKVINCFIIHHSTCYTLKKILLKLMKKTKKNE